MASAVLPDKYIPAGCLAVDVDVNVLIEADRGLWLADRVPEWTSCLPLGGAPENASSVVTALCEALFPKALQQAPPPQCALSKLYAKGWVWFAFRFVERMAGRGLCRVYVLPDDECRRLIPRSDTKLRRELQCLLAALDYAGDVWHGRGQQDSTPVTLEAAVAGGEGRESELNSISANGSGADMSLLQMFNTIPSPRPQPELIQDPDYQDVMDALAASKIRGLKSTLYAYQSRSAAVMLQRELCPGRIVDPRLQRLPDPATGAPWYYDSVTGEVLRAPRFYDGVCGGILAEEMGTGKTLICLSLILATRAFPSAMPEVCRGSILRRPRIGSLADMAAAVATRESVPWRLYLGGEAEGREGQPDNLPDYTRCIDVIKRNPASYVLPRFELAECRRAKATATATVTAPVDQSAPPVHLSRCSLVVVPANLVRQWEQEIKKHTDGLVVLVVAAKLPMPTVAAILDADILLFSIPRFEKLERHRHIVRAGWRFHSPLASVHFKRVIVDEGHRLGNSRISKKSDLLLVLDCLQTSARWIVTGTPSTGLFGVDESSDQSSPVDTPATPATDTPVTATATASTPPLASSSALQERKDLERIGAMASLYLRVRPWANTSLDTSDTPADWAVYVMQPKHSSRSSGRRDCLRATLDALIVRHRKSEVGDLLPPVVEKVVLLDGSHQDKLCLNLFSMMIIFNAVQSQRTDQDYFFHPKQRGALLQLLSNIRQATFFGGFFYSTAEIAKAVATAAAFLHDRKVPISDDDDRLLRQAIAFGTAAQANKFKRLADVFHEIPIHVRDFPGGGRFAQAWSMDGEEPSGSASASASEGGREEGDGDGDDDGGGREDGRGDGDGDDKGSSHLTCTTAPMIHALQQFLRPCIDAPHSLQAMFSDGRFVRKGHEVRARVSRQAQGQSLPGQGPPGPPGPPERPVTPPPTHRHGHGRRKPPPPTLAGNTRLGDDGSSSSPLKLRSGALGTPARMDGIPAPGDVPETEIAAPLAGAQIVATASAKLSYLLDAIVRHQDDEQIIVFYDNDNVAFYLAEHLEILQIHHLIYARGITAARRAQYVDTFNHNARFRVLLMDISQAAFGLDMRSASRVYFIHPVLNPQVEAQAIGRVRRISQQRQVSVETLVLRDSLEELIVERRQTMTQAEHRQLKTILDDRPIYEWILHAKILPLDDNVDETCEMAPLRTPQFLFGRGFGRVEHPDEGLVAAAQATAEPEAAAKPEVATAASASAAPTPKRPLVQDSHDKPKPKPKRPRVQVRFAE